MLVPSRLIRELSTLPERLVVPVLSYVTASTEVPVLFAASRAVTVIEFIPGNRVMLATLQLVVPLAVPVALLAAFRQVTLATPTLSAAVPDKETAEAVVR